MYSKNALINVDVCEREFVLGKVTDEYTQSIINKDTMKRRERKSSLNL